MPHQMPTWTLMQFIDGKCQKKACLFTDNQHPRHCMPGAWSLDSCRSPQINSQVKLVTCETWLTNTIFDSAKNHPFLPFFCFAINIFHSWNHQVWHLKMNENDTFMKLHCFFDKPLLDECATQIRQCHIKGRGGTSTLPTGLTCAPLQEHSWRSWRIKWHAADGTRQQTTLARVIQDSTIRYHISMIWLMYDQCIPTKSSGLKIGFAVDKHCRSHALEFYAPCSTNPRDQVIIDACGWYPYSWPERKKMCTVISLT